MAKGFIKKTFGKKFGISDLLLLGIILGYPAYVVYKGGIEILLGDVIRYLWTGVVVAYVAYFLVKRARK